MSLPTYPLLGAIPPPITSAHHIAEGWLSAFSSAVSQHDIRGITSLFIDDGWWRDLLSLTWDFRSFHGPTAISTFLTDRLALSQLASLKLSSSPPPQLLSPYRDLGWIQALFTFETAVGAGTAVVRLVYLPSGEWKAWTLITMLDSLKCSGGEIDFDYPERVEWAKMREEEEQFTHADPAVIIVGAGQTGLGVAARLKALGVTSLVVERNERIGDQWRKGRYASLRLHNPTWRDHLPLFPFPDPPLWPVFIPGVKLADFLESYAKQLDLNVWTASTIRNPKWNPSSKMWTVTICRNGSERVMKARHIVWATGLDAGIGNMPKYDGMGTFKGKIIHSSQYHTPAEYKSKKVVVIGAGVSSHDICMDFASESSDITMIQRSSTYIMSIKTSIPTLHKQLHDKGSPPTELADVLLKSFPQKITMLLSVRMAAKLAEMDRELLDGLHRVGFRTNMGLENAGKFRLVTKRAGGWYTGKICRLTRDQQELTNISDVGASQMLIEGKIKLKNDSVIDSFTETGLRFTDGSQLSADVVICATGYGHVKAAIQDTFGEDMSSKLKEIWDWDAEYEMNSVWRDSGVEGFYVATSNLPGCRFWSRFLALQIKAMEAGLFGTRYSLG